MRAYLDASVLVSLFVRDSTSPWADAFLRGAPLIVIVSDLAKIELASAVSRRARMSELSRDDARSVLASFDAWMTRKPERITLTASDLAVADTFIRRLDLALRPPDALHIAAAQRIGAPLATFDARMAADARTLGVALADA